MPPRRGPGLLFHLAAGATTVFIITVLALVATLFANPNAPVNIWLNTHGGTLLGVEVAAIAMFGVAAMAQDQRLQRREQATLRDPVP
jgi:hypothetical protein